MFLAKLVAYGFEHKTTATIFWFNASLEAVERMRKDGIDVRKNNAMGHWSWWVRLS